MLYNIKHATLYQILYLYLKKEYEGGDFVKGPSKDSRSEPQINPAEISAKNMEKLVHDQLTESSATSVFRHSLFEMALLGTGIVKGPFNFNKTLNRWTEEDGERKANVIYE